MLPIHASPENEVPTHSLPQIHVQFVLHELEMLLDPEYFRCRFEIQFDWDSDAISANDVQQFYFVNARDTMSIKRIKEQMNSFTQNNPKAKSLRYIVEGAFKAYNDYRSYPFDKHEIPIILAFQNYDSNEMELVATSQDLSIRLRSVTKLSGWVLSKLAFYPGSNGFLHSYPEGADGKEISVAGIMIYIQRDYIRVFVRIIAPMMLIWLMGYSGFFWYDSSPASRCGTAAIFAAIAFSLEPNFLNIRVGYITMLNIIFLALYFNIVICFIWITAFFSVKEGPLKRFRKPIWYLGVITCPLLVLLCVAISVWFGSLSRYDSIYDHPAPIVKNYERLHLQTFIESRKPWNNQWRIEE